MTEMDDHIARYPDLTPEERREVEAYVRAHPDLEPALHTAQRVDAALRAGRSFDEHPPSDEVMAYAVVMGEVDFERMPDVLAGAVRRLLDNVQADPELKARFDRMKARRDALTRNVDVEAEFARLTGGRRGDVPPQRGTGRSAGRTGRLGRAARIALSIAAAYLALFILGQLTRPALERLAAFDRTELSLEGYEQIRGGGEVESASDAVASYLNALDELRRAEQSLWGLFPRYDSDRLDAAAVELRRVLELEPDESFLFSEAAFLLGKVELARGNVEAARTALERVTSMGGRHAAEAERLLDAIDARNADASG